MGLFQLALALAVLVVLVSLVNRLALWARLLRYRLRPVRVEAVPSTELPLELGPVFEAADQELTALGFRATGARRVDSVVTIEGPRPQLVYTHPEAQALAVVGPPVPGSGDRPFQVAFLTAFRDGTVVATYDGLSHLTFGLPPTWECHDHGLDDLRRQWTLHFEACKPHGGAHEALSLSSADWARREDAALDETLRAWERAGYTAPCPSEASAWRITPRGAWALTQRMLAGQKRLAARESGAERNRARQELWRSAAVEPEASANRATRRARAAAMAWGFEYVQAADEARTASRTSAAKWAAAAVSGAAFLVAFGLYLSWEIAVLFLIVLLIHELGHLAGMIAFRYRDRRILFLPFLGAATIGEKPEASAAQRTVVYLLGPVPGLVLGFLCLQLFAEGAGDWWLLAGVSALVVNYLNLLPVLPLDGGRIVETLLLGRFPRAQAVFLGVGAAAFGWVAWRFGDPLLGVIAVLLFAAVPARWRWAAAAHRLRPRLDPSASRADRVHAVFEALQEKPFAQAPAPHRHQMAKGILAQLDARPPRLGTALAGGLVYVSLLVGVPVAAGSYLYDPIRWVEASETSRSLIPASVGGEGAVEPGPVTGREGEAPARQADAASLGASEPLRWGKSGDPGDSDDDDGETRGTAVTPVSVSGGGEPRR